ncbi:unnamed protein product [Bursaphelenchus okinawaensis]|uniref:Uncharacterized protein n=1 Tax=Bursaphelenchus okinawaensis TaxID=465554 RepID=A0A811KEE0_9BILA|nr:unnamed protein product [Bursaphelenchus okinawaensis]CAG9102279.1 unnamed protein product [Bursaphelenchus okinawaensis]
MAEDWGAVTSEDLFDRAGQMKPLKDLINEAAYGQGVPMKHNDAFEFVSSSPMNWWSQPNPENKLLPGNYTPPQPTKRAPKILKKNGLKKENQLALQKRVTFDIERFVNSDGLSLDERRLVEMGAKPRKSKGINYRQLKEERAQKKAEDKLAGPKLITKLKKKQQKGRKQSKKA